MSRTDGAEVVARNESGEVECTLPQACLRGARLHCTPKALIPSFSMFSLFIFFPASQCKRVILQLKLAGVQIRPVIPCALGYSTPPKRWIRWAKMLFCNYYPYLFLERNFIARAMKIDLIEYALHLDRTAARSMCQGAWLGNRPHSESFPFSFLELAHVRANWWAMDYPWEENVKKVRMILHDSPDFQISR